MREAHQVERAEREAAPDTESEPDTDNETEPELELKTPWKDGTAWLAMTADTFLERLASLVPRPGTHQVLFRGSER